MRHGEGDRGRAGNHTMSEAKKCPNGHAANADGQCGDANCPYTYKTRNDGIGR